jgi:hypothetical protein
MRNQTLVIESALLQDEFFYPKLPGAFHQAICLHNTGQSCIDMDMEQDKNTAVSFSKERNPKMKLILPFLQSDFFTHLRAPHLGGTHLPGLSSPKKLNQAARVLEHGWQKLVLLGLFGLGVFLGAKTAGSATEGWQARLFELLRAQRLNRASLSILGSVVGYFGTDFIFLLAAFLLGLCAAGLPFLLLLPVLRGLGLGVVSGWLYMTHGVAGIGYSVLVLYPGAVVSLLVMLAYCKESMLMSGDMLLMATGKLEHAESSMRLFTSRYLMLLLITVLAAALDTLCFTAFSGVFQI